jgi:hypothetical protein
MPGQDEATPNDLAKPNLFNKISQTGTSQHGTERFLRSSQKAGAYDAAQRPLEGEIGCGSSASIPERPRLVRSAPNIHRESGRRG